jgi:hypothetical protein
MSIYIHNKEIMTNYTEEEPYPNGIRTGIDPESTWLNRVSLLGQTVVDGENLILMEPHLSFADPLILEFSPGTYRMTYLYGASKFSASPGSWFNAQEEFRFTEEESTFSQPMPGYNVGDYIPAQTTPLGMENLLRGTYIDTIFTLNQEYKFFYSAGNGDGSVLFHFKRLSLAT